MPKIKEKTKIIENIKNETLNSKMVILVDFLGLTVEQDTIMRKNIKKEGFVFKVFKNTMIKRAFEKTKYEPLNEYLKGSSAIVVSNDEDISKLKSLYKYIKDYEKLNYKIGFINDKICEFDEFSTLANIPSKKELILKLLISLKYSFIKFTNVINCIKENKEKTKEEVKKDEEKETNKINQESKE